MDYCIFLEEMYKSFIFRKHKDPKIKNAPFRNAYYSFLSLGDDAIFDDIDLKLMKKYETAINDTQ